MKNKFLNYVIAAGFILAAGTLFVQAQYGPGGPIAGASGYTTNAPAINTNVYSGYNNYTSPPLATTYFAVISDTNGNVAFPANLNLAGNRSSNLVAYVDRNAVGTGQVNNVLQPFKTLDQAFSALPAAPPFPPLIKIIGNGTNYFGNTISNCSVVGESHTLTTIIYTNANNFANRSYAVAFEVAANNLTFRGFTFGTSYGGPTNQNIYCMPFEIYTDASGSMVSNNLIKDVWMPLWGGCFDGVYIAARNYAPNIEDCTWDLPWDLNVANGGLQTNSSFTWRNNYFTSECLSNNQNNINIGRIFSSYGINSPGITANIFNTTFILNTTNNQGIGFQLKSSGFQANFIGCVFSNSIPTNEVWLSGNTTPSGIVNIQGCMLHTNALSLINVAQANFNYEDWYAGSFVSGPETVLGPTYNSGIVNNSNSVVNYLDERWTNAAYANADWRRTNSAALAALVDTNPAVAGSASIIQSNAGGIYIPGLLNAGSLNVANASAIWNRTNNAGLLQDTNLSVANSGSVITTNTTGGGTFINNQLNVANTLQVSSTLVNLNGAALTGSGVIGSANNIWETNGLLTRIPAGGIPTVASGTTIAAPTSTDIFFVSGTTAIATITIPTGWGSTGQGQITIIPTGLWTTTTGGNIAIASTAVVSKALIMTYSQTTSKWYPSY